MGVYTVGRMIEDLRTIAGDSSSDWFGSKARQTAEECLAIFTSGRWPFNEGEGAVATVAPYTTGTVAVSTGSQSVTLTGGTWLTSWSVPAVIRIYGSNGDNFQVTSFNSPSNLTIDAPWPFTGVTTSSYSVEFPALDVPSYQSVTGLVQARLTAMGAPVRGSMGAMLANRPWQPSSWWPVEYDVIPSDGVTSQKIFLWPPPAAVQVIRYRYIKAVPAFRAYREGVASVTNASVNVAGTDTFFTAQGYSLAGQYFEMIAQPGHQIQVASVTNDAALVLVAGGYTGKTQAGGGYWVSPSILVPDDLKPLLRAIMRWKYHEDQDPKKAQASKERYQFLRDQAVARYDVARDIGAFGTIETGEFNWAAPPLLPSVVQAEYH